MQLIVCLKCHHFFSLSSPFFLFPPFFLHPYLSPYFFPRFFLTPMVFILPEVSLDDFKKCLVATAECAYMLFFSQKSFLNNKRVSLFKMAATICRPHALNRSSCCFLKLTIILPREFITHGKC